MDNSFLNRNGLLLCAEGELQAADTGEIRDGLYYNLKLPKLAVLRLRLGANAQCNFLLDSCSAIYLWAYFYTFLSVSESDVCPQRISYSVHYERS